MKQKPSPVTSRHGAVITPLGADAAASTEDVTTQSTTAFGATTFTPNTAEPRTEDTIPDTLPDPLDFHGFTMEDKDSAAVTPEESAVSASQEENQNPVVPSASEDSDEHATPFLQDAKFDKRPLGAFSAEVADEPDVPQDTQVDDAVVAAETALPVTMNNEELPAELQTDVLAIESDQIDRAEQSSTETESLQTTEPVAPEPEEKPAPAAPAVSRPEAAPAGETLSLASGSISQQYREKVQPGGASADTDTSIYDTSTYHQALKHPVKQRSGWVSVVLILLLIVIGAGGGAAVYFLTNQ